MWGAPLNGLSSGLCQREEAYVGKQQVRMWLFSVLDMDSQLSPCLGFLVTMTVTVTVGCGMES